MERREHRKTMMTGDRQSTHRRPGSGRPCQNASHKKQKHVKRAYSKLKQRLGEVKTYELDALEDLNAVVPIASTSGDHVDRAARGRPRNDILGASPSGDVKQRRDASKRNRTKEKKAFFKKTRSGQPVMSSRINKLLENIKSS